MDETFEGKNTGGLKTEDGATETRDENMSPTSGSSSDPCADGVSPEVSRKRKASRNHRSKRKRKWKPYSELSWDEKMVQDDWETRRAYAKRERLSAEGHPIAPYNTTQFLMEDRKIQASISEDVRYSPVKKVEGGQGSSLANNNEDKLEAGGASPVLSGSCKQQLDNVLIKSVSNGAMTNDCQTELNDSNADGGKYMTALPKHMQHPSCNSPQRGVTSIEKVSSTTLDNYRNEAEIQRYILDDFSHTYADIHAEELQAKTKADLVDECLKLERKVSLCYINIISSLVVLV